MEYNYQSLETRELLRVCSCGCGEFPSKRSKLGYKHHHYWRIYRSPNIFTEGHEVWWKLKGKNHPGLENLRPHKKGEFKHSKETKEKLRGIFNRGIAPMTALRRSADYFEWRKSVFERDDFTCLKCEERGGRIITPHHIYSFKEHPDKRFEKSNGATLCLDCHKKFHRKYGISNNTLEQFLKFLNIEI